MELQLVLNTYAKDAFRIQADCDYVTARSDYRPRSRSTTTSGLDDRRRAVSGGAGLAGQERQSTIAAQNALSARTTAIEA